MEYEKIEIKDLNKLKTANIYYLLKHQNFSENYIKKLRNCENGILLNNLPTTTRQKISANDILFVAKNPKSPTTIDECDGEIEPLFEDDDFLIVNKPHNLSCMPTRSHYGNNLGGQIVKYFRKKSQDFVLRIINRLDKDASGIVIVAKNQISANNINIEKCYHALCFGNANFNETTIDKPIKTINENGVNQIKRVIASDGKSAITHAYVIKQFDEYFLSEIKIETGRTHQIRLHMSSIGHPLLGDRLYANEQTIDMLQDLTNHTFLLLKKISFTHFRTKQKISIEVPYPIEWGKFIKK